MRPDLNAVALFVGVVEHRSFSEASKRLAVPISTVSRKVAELEKTMGIRLLERSTRQLRLTEPGREYYEYCRRGLAEFEAGALKINDRQEEVSGTLRISAPPSIADVLLAPVISAFQAHYPGVNANIHMTERKVNLIEDKVDIALRVGPLDDSSLMARRLLSYRHVLVASPEYLDANGMPGQPDALHSHRLISFDGWHEEVFWVLTNKAGKKNQQQKNVAKIKVNSILSINDYAGIQHAACTGCGIANMPALLCSKQLRNKQLIEVLPGWRFAPVVLFAVYPGNRNIMRTVRLFIDFLVKYMAENADMQSAQSF
ncbi:MAG: LysR family transcriptional regulator [Gammaproteobacteria bacterium]|nr:LysR family transcriptional regulator [Gammaproteobacteria bacterium]